MRLLPRASIRVNVAESFGRKGVDGQESNSRTLRNTSVTRRIRRWVLATHPFKYLCVSVGNSGIPRLLAIPIKAVYLVDAKEKCL